MENYYTVLHRFFLIANLPQRKKIKLLSETQYQILLSTFLKYQTRLIDPNIFVTNENENDFELKEQQTNMTI